MMSKVLLALSVATLLQISPTAAQAQTEAPHTTASAAPTADVWKKNAVMQWRDLHNKLLDMAKDTLFPESKYGTRPHPDSRSAIEEFRHVTLGVEYVVSSMNRQGYDWEGHEAADAKKPATRESVVHDMQAAINTLDAMLDEKAGPGILGMIEHQAEHYGKLVSAYRLAGIVPPVSRTKPADLSPTSGRH